MASEKGPDVAPYIDPVVQAYKNDVDVTLLRENLKLTVEQRIDRLQDFANFIEEIRGSARQCR